MNPVYCFTNFRCRLLHSVLVAIGLLAGLNTWAQVEDDAVDAPTADPSLSEDPEALSHVFAAEYEGSEGDMESAAQRYLQAALASEDPAVAQRATGVALAAQAWQFAAMASDRWTQLAPDSVDARGTAARAQLLAGDYVAAEHHLGRLLELKADTPLDGWNEVAGLLSLSRHSEKTQAMLDHLVDEHGGDDNPYALYARSQVTARGGDLETAFVLAERSAATAVEDPEIQAWTGRLAANVERMDLAADYLRKAWELQPDDIQNALLLANVLRQQERGDEAHDILAAVPDNPELRFTRIAFAMEAGDRERALSVYEGFAEADYPEAELAAFHAGRSAELLEKPEDALAWYGQVSNGQTGLIALVRSAFLLRDLGRLDDARAMLAEAREVGDDTVRIESLVAESQMLLDADDPATAFDLLGLALQQKPSDTRLLYTRALVAVELDRIGVAESDLRKVLQQEPQNAAALNALGYTLADRTDRYLEAEQYIRAAFALQPEEASIIDSMGWVAYRLGRLDEAVAFLAEAFERDRNAEIAAHLGEVLWKLGREQEAQAVWLQGRHIDADNRVLKETLRRIGVSF